MDGCCKILHFFRHFQPGRLLRSQDPTLLANMVQPKLHHEHTLNTIRLVPWPGVSRHVTFCQYMQPTCEEGTRSNYLQRCEACMENGTGLSCVSIKGIR